MNMFMEGKAIGLLFLLFSIGIIAGCSSSNSDPDQPTVDNVSVTGLVRSPDRVVLENVEVYNDDGVLATSDSSGLVSFSVAPGKASSIRLRKSGYAAQTVMLEINGNRADFLATLGKRSAAITVSADAAIDITGTAGAMVKLAAGALVDASGNPVTGDVQLSITPVDISDDDELGVFPGAFSGTDIDGNAAPVIMSYGTVEYQFSQNGDELNLAAGQSATIEIPVFVTNHPDGTPIQIGDSGALWYLDETTGQWVQEDVGIIVASIGSPTGMALQATVTHFSWWNYDIAPELCDLSVTTSGLPADAVVSLFARTQGDRPRSGAAEFLRDGQTLFMPRGVATYFESTATSASDGFYTAYAVIYACNGTADSLVLNYTGPEAPKIMAFEGRVKPIFDLEIDPTNPSSLRQARVGNDAIFTWEVLGAESMALTSDEGHATTLGSAAGSTQFPLDLSGTHAAQYAFTLTATTPDNTVTQVVNLTYDETPVPILHESNVSLSISLTAQIATVSWDVEGADSISISYAPPYGGSKTQIAADPDVAPLGATILDLNRDIFDTAGAGIYMISVEFTNQYGTTTRSYAVRVYDLSGGVVGDGSVNDGPPT